MPLPLIPVALMLLTAGGVGAGAGASGVNDMNEAKKTADRARRKYEGAHDCYRKQEATTKSELESYGRTQLAAQTTTLADWVSWLQANERKVRRLERQYVDGVRVATPDLPTLGLVVCEAKSLLQGGASAAVSAVIAQQAALAGVRALATAGTGAAISGLTGVALESASLAWLGGGTLAAGGGGVAAGGAMLTGVAVAPALLIGGITLAIQGEKARTQAEDYRAQVNVAMEQMSTHCQLLERLSRRAGELRTTLRSLDDRAQASLVRLGALDFDPERYASTFQETALLMRGLATLLDTPLLNNDGDVNTITIDLKDCA